MAIQERTNVQDLPRRDPERILDAFKFLFESIDKPLNEEEEADMLGILKGKKKTSTHFVDHDTRGIKDLED